MTGPTRSLSLELSDTRVCAPQIRASLGTTAHFCKVVVLELRAVPSCADLVQRKHPTIVDFIVLKLCTSIIQPSGNFHGGKILRLNVLRIQSDYPAPETLVGSKIPLSALPLFFHCQFFKEQRQSFLAGKHLNVESQG